MICEKHGEYEPKILRTMGIEITLGCEKCTEDQRALEKKRELEALERDQVEIRKRRLGFAAIPIKYKGFTIEDCRKFYPKETAEAMEWLDKARQEACSLLFKGSLGRGKTTLACVILSEWCKVKTGLFTTMYNMDKESQDDPDKFINTPLLVIDEVGRQMVTEASENRRFEIINERYNALRPTIFIGNITEKQFLEHIGEAAYHRVQESITHIVLNGKNLRVKS